MHGTAPALDTVRLTLHVLAASVWVGGQIVMSGMVSPLRTVGNDAPQVMARAFARMAWPAYVVLIATGFWNLSTFHWAAQSSAWKAVFMAKVVVVVAAGVGAFFHQRATTKPALALWGSVAGTASIAALTMGILLAG
jgi:putative copper export protein